MTNKNIGVDLKDFIAQTIEDIFQGVNEGKRQINSPLFSRSETTEIKFDLMVTSTQEKLSGTDGKIRVKVMNIVDLGADGNTNQKTTLLQTNRISFSVPLILRTKQIDIPEYAESNY